MPSGPARARARACRIARSCRATPAGRPPSNRPLPALPRQSRAAAHSHSAQPTPAGVAARRRDRHAPQAPAPAAARVWARRPARTVRQSWALHRGQSPWRREDRSSRPRQPRLRLSQVFGRVDVIERVRGARRAREPRDGGVMLFGKPHHATMPGLQSASQIVAQVHRPQREGRMQPRPVTPRIRPEVRSRERDALCAALSGKHQPRHQIAGQERRVARCGDDMRMAPRRCMVHPCQHACQRTGMIGQGIGAERQAKGRIARGTPSRSSATAIAEAGPKSARSSRQAPQGGITSPRRLTATANSTGAPGSAALAAPMATASAQIEPRGRVHSRLMPV